jgi:phage portal protein BeeE
VHQLFPYDGSVWVEPRTLTRQVWDSRTARAIPGVARALELYKGLISQLDMDPVRGETVLPRPRLLERPDPDMAQTTFLGLHVEDYLLHGNAAHLVTVRDSTGYPAAVRWYGAHRWNITEEPFGIQYWLDGRRVDRGDVIHVRRGADPAFPWRGVGVVEQHLATLDRAGLQEAAETAQLRDRNMPGVAIIKPNPDPDPVVDDAVADKWVERFTGPVPKPAIFPQGTQVIPLSWKPSDAEMTAARQLTLKDLANLFNLDGYWLGAEGSSHTYRSPGAMLLAMLKTSLNPVMRVIEDEWSYGWLPRGQLVRFDRSELLRDDLLTMAQAFATGAALFPDPNEPRQLMGLPALPADAWPDPPAAPPPPPVIPDPTQEVPA